MADASPGTASPSTPAAAPNTPDAPSAPATQAGARPNPTPQEAPAQSKVYERKVNGKVVRYTEQELLDRVGKADAADERFNEAAKMRREAEARFARIKNPDQMIEALMDPALGYTKEQIKAKFEEWYEREFIEPDKLTEDQKKLREAERKLKAYAEQEKQRVEAKANAEREEMTAKARGELQKQIIEACETGGLPKNNFTARRLAYWMQRNLQNGFEAPTSLLVSQVRGELTAVIRDLVETTDGEALINALGEGVIQKVRKYDLDQLRKLRNPPPAPDAPATPADPGKPRERPPSSAEVTRKLRELQRTGRY